MLGWWTFDAISRFRWTLFIFVLPVIAAVECFLALALDGLGPSGGYPSNDNDDLTLEQDKPRKDMVNSAPHLKANALSAGKTGAAGLYWASTTNFLAVMLGDDLNAAYRLMAWHQLQTT